MASGDFKFSVNETDYARIMRAFEEMADIEKNYIVQKSFKQGSQMLLVAGKASFLAKNKKVSGNLFRSFTDKLKKKKKNIGGIYVGFKRGKDLGNHAHLINYPTTHRFTKQGYYRGKIDQAGIGSRGRKKTGATYFWSKVVESKGPEAMNHVTNAIFRAIAAIRG